MGTLSAECQQHVLYNDFKIRSMPYCCVNPDKINKVCFYCC